ncbi:nitroreductase [Robiginitalea sp. SC105]|uniref:nitroreductase family protein n=1 Tax=Robiginitalea sp. SC105 TaxID=2762332 RepID=UPI0016398F29|nr:nitroreductase [Robiginitalea sp. SC105]MBC2838669.1 nitroreductase [Robiginitalea sp. SC105]
MIEELIRRRRSVFPDQYNDQPVDRATLFRILEAANWAPTHKRTEPWRFKVIAGEKREQLGAFLRDTYLEKDPAPKQFKAKKLYNNPQKAAAVIAICLQRDPEERVPEWEEVASVAMAVQNMWLVCTELGIGSYWSSPGLIRYMDGFFDLAAGERCLGFFYLGYFDAEHAPPEGTREPLSEKVVWM